MDADTVGGSATRDRTLEAPVSSGPSLSLQRRLSLVPFSDVTPHEQEISPAGLIHPSLTATDTADIVENLDTLIVLAEWRVWMQVSLAPNTVKHYWGCVFRFFAAVPKPIGGIREVDVARWLETYPFRSASRRAGYEALKSFFSWALRQGYVLDNPMAGIKVVNPKEKVPRALTEEQYEAVKAAAYAHNPVRGYAVELLYYSAGRITETLSLTWDDVTQDGVVFKHTKNGNERLVPWSDGLRRAVEGLRTQFGERSRVLPRSQQTVWLWVREAGKDAGVEGVHPHLFRATAATRALHRGARANAVRSILGHSKLSTTQRYLADDAEDIQEAVNLLNG
jgi:integrase